MFQELYSPHVDVSQRLLVLDSLAAAAADLSCLPTRSRIAAVAQTAGSSNTYSSPSEDTDPNAVDPRTGGKASRTRVWGLSSLRKRHQGRPESSRNRFTADVALAWSLPTMQQFDVKSRHGIDLMGKDFLVLGRLLVTLGGFVEASGQVGPATPTLGAALLELVSVRDIIHHPQVGLLHFSFDTASSSSAHGLI